MSDGMSGEANLAMLLPPSRVLSEHIADQLRQAIVTDQLKPGERIVEREIAKAMETSRGPVRDALLLLENEGLVMRYPHRGSFVTSLSIEDAEEIYSLRLALELLAVEYVVKRATPEQLDELDGYVKQMADVAAQTYDVGQFTELDLAFHRAICRLSGHKRLLDAWEQLSVQTRVLLLTQRKRNPRKFEERDVEWHGHLVETLRQRDLASAQEEMRKHLAAAVEDLFNLSEEG